MLGTCLLSFADWIRSRPLRRWAAIGLGVLAACQTVQAQQGFINNTPITIPGAGTFGPGAPYPSPIIVTGLKRPVAHVIVSLNGYTHACSNDVAAVLVGPQGQKVLLFGQCNSCHPGPANATLYFDDQAAANFPTDNVVIPTTGFYRPGSNCFLGGSSLSAPAPSAPYAAALSAFNGTDGNGTWRLYVEDFLSNDTGVITGGWSLFITEAGSPVVTASGNGVLIPNGAPGTSSGIGAPYPSSILFLGISGKVSSVSVRINSLTHSFLRDLDVLLVGPNGQTCMLMSDVGGSNPGTFQTTLAFTDGAPASLTSGDIPISGTYKPTDMELPAETMPAPAPPGPYGSTLGVFKGSNPNGFWSLYINDDSNGDTGVAGLWDLTLHIEEPCPADYNGSGLLDVGDIFAFLTAWFGGCP